MTTTENWWETIFEGPLSLGINKDRVNDLDEEHFLYFEAPETIEESVQ